MKYGYMPSSEEDLLKEISFAKKHFDSLELTLKPDFSYTAAYIKKIIVSLGGFPLIGHLHWTIDLSRNKATEIKKAIKYISIFKKLGAKKIVVHPSANPELSDDIVKENNLRAISKISGFCQKNALSLYIENVTKAPFNTALTLNYLAEKLNSGIALDTGHANKISKKVFGEFLKLNKRIKHIHLHNTINGLDHLPFNDMTKLRRLMHKIRKIPYNKTLTLEIFDKIKDSSSVPMPSDERKEVLLEQLRELRSIT